MGQLKDRYEQIAEKILSEVHGIDPPEEIDLSAIARGESNAERALELPHGPVIIARDEIERLH